MSDHRAEPTEDDSDEGVHSFGKGEIALFVLAVLVAATAGVFGFINSFEAVMTWAAKAGFKYPALLPLSIDLLIPALGVINCLLIRADAPARWLRWMPLLLTVGTVFLNVQSATHIWYKIAHGMAAAVFALVSEVGMHWYRHLHSIETGGRMDRIRPLRWVLAPFRTFKIWRGMYLWETTSYLEALDLERNRLLGIADLEEKYGKKWEKEAPARVLIALKMGMTPAQVAVVDKALTTAQPVAEPVHTPAAPAPVEPAPEPAPAPVAVAPVIVPEPVSTPPLTEVPTPAHQVLTQPLTEQFTPAHPTPIPAPAPAPAWDWQSVQVPAPLTRQEPVHTPQPEVFTPVQEVLTEVAHEVYPSLTQDMNTTASASAPAFETIYEEVGDAQREHYRAHYADPVEVDQADVDQDQADDVDQADVDGDQDQGDGEGDVARLSAEDAAAVIADCWKNGVSQRKAAARATRSPSYVMKVYAQLTAEAEAANPPATGRHLSSAS